MSGKSVSKAWRRRERSLAGGLVIWALWVSAMLTVSPEALSEWALNTEPLAVGGSIMVTVALLAGLVNTLWSAYDWWSTPADPKGLTEVPWDE